MKNLLLFALFSVPVFGVTGDVELQGKVANNLNLQGEEKTVESEKVRTGFLGRSFLPTLLFELGQERFQTGRYQSYNNPYGLLEARVNLFRGGRDRIESELRNLSVTMADLNRQQTLRDQLNKVRKLQWQIIHNQNLIRLLEDEVKQNTSIKSQAERRARSGVATRSDTLEFNIHASELEEALESLRHENKILRIGLLPHLGVENDSGLSFPDELAHEHDDDLLSKPFASRKTPQVFVLEAEYESHLLQKRSDNLWWTPKLDLYAGYYLYTLRDRDYLDILESDDRVIGARITFELFDGLRSVNQASATHYQAEAKHLQSRFLEKKTEAEYLMLKEDLHHTHEVMHYVEDRIKKSKDYLKVTLQEYDRGVKNSLDALVAMQRYYRYEKDLLKKKHEYQTIKADILALRGE